MAHSYIPSTTLLLLAILCSVFAPQLTDANPPAIFIFGDSTADVGTNHFVPDTLAKADFPHYGIDIGNKSTGRFSNGLITVDFLSMLMGFRRSPQPFLFLSSLRNAFQRKMFRGVNFASGSSGLLNVTSEIMRIVDMSEQVTQFITVRNNLTARRGQSLTAKLLSESIFIVSVGNNDILEYIATNTTVPKEEFIKSLMTAYEGHIKVLYDLGARKFGIISVIPLGCTPAQRVLNVTGGCLSLTNDIALSFYSELDALLQNFSSNHKEFKYSLGNTYNMTMAVVRNPARYNFRHVDTACCGSGRFNGEQLCNAMANLCEKRNEYAFWDAVHPTQAASRLAARALYSGELRYATPINFGQLAADS